MKPISPEHFESATRFLNRQVTIKIDRPLGSSHPQWGFVYPINYGFVPNTPAPDGEDLDAYLLGVSHPVEEFTGRCIAVIQRQNDADDKLVIAPEGMNFSNQEIMAEVNFQEQHFVSQIIRGDSL